MPHRPFNFSIPVPMLFVCKSNYFSPCYRSLSIFVCMPLVRPPYRLACCGSRSTTALTFTHRSSRYLHCQLLSQSPVASSEAIFFDASLFPEPARHCKYGQIVSAVIQPRSS